MIASTLLSIGAATVITVVALLAAFVIFCIGGFIVGMLDSWSARP